MLITCDLFLVSPYDPEDKRNGFTVTRQDGTIVAHTTTHESACAAARLMALGAPDNVDFNRFSNPFDWPYDFGPVFNKHGDF